MIAAAIVVLGVIVGAVILSTGSGNTAGSGNLSEEQKEELRVFKAVAPLRMARELAKLKSAGDSLDEVTTQLPYYRDMPFEELAAEYEAHFPARWHALKKEFNQ